MKLKKVVIFSLVGVFLLGAAAFATVPENSFSQRQVGDPVEGYWYFTQFHDGCFVGGTYIEIAKKKIYFVTNRIKNQQMIVDRVKTEIEKDQIKLTYRSRILDRQDRLTFVDQGTELKQILREITIVGQTKKMTKNQQDLTHCSKPSLWGQIKVALRLERYLQK